MRNLGISKDELAKMYSPGRGTNSTVYKYNDRLALKVLNQDGLRGYDEKEFLNILGIQNSTCVFPQEMVEVGEGSLGYLMDYVQGTTLIKIIKKIDFSTLIAAIKRVEEDTHELSKIKMIFEDLNQGGLMWDEEKYKIRIIDTDFFIKADKATEEECYERSIESFYSLIEQELGIIDGIGSRLAEYLQNNSEFSTLYAEHILSSLRGKNRSVIELIEKAIEIFEQDFGRRPKNIEEMEQLLEERVVKQGICVTPADIVAADMERKIQFENHAALRMFSDVNLGAEGERY